MKIMKIKDRGKYRFTVGGDVFKVMNWLAWAEGSVAGLDVLKVMI